MLLFVFTCFHIHASFPQIHTKMGDRGKKSRKPKKEICVGEEFKIALDIAIQDFRHNEEETGLYNLANMCTSHRFGCCFIFSCILPVYMWPSTLFYSPLLVFFPPLPLPSLYCSNLMSVSSFPFLLSLFLLTSICLFSFLLSL